MEWLKWLGDLSPVALLVVAVWVIATKIITPLLRSHERAVQEITMAHTKEAESFSRSLDENTAAVRQSVQHNERIISNHLSHETEIWNSIKEELVKMHQSVERMNNRRRWTDGETNSGGK